jgi:hypothetical protein
MVRRDLTLAFLVRVAAGVLAVLAVVWVFVPRGSYSAPADGASGKTQVLSQKRTRSFRTRSCGSR